MTEQQHRATDSEWYCIKARGCGSKTEIPATYSTIHELLCRIEALEAAAQPAKSNQLEIPDSSLLSQVAAVIENGTACHKELKRIAREVICAVAAYWSNWLREHYGGRTATTYLLEQEAEQ